MKKEIEMLVKKIQMLKLSNNLLEMFSEIDITETVRINDELEKTMILMFEKLDNE